MFIDKNFPGGILEVGIKTTYFKPNSGLSNSGGILEVDIKTQYLGVYTEGPGVLSPVQTGAVKADYADEVVNINGVDVTAHTVNITGINNKLTIQKAYAFNSTTKQLLETAFDIRCGKIYFLDTDINNLNQFVLRLDFHNGQTSFIKLINDNEFIITEDNINVIEGGPGENNGPISEG